MILRLAAPGAPTLREIARKMSVSPAALSHFELGRQPLSLELMKRYAKAVGKSVAEVRGRFLRAAYAYHSAKKSELAKELEASGRPKSRSGRSLSREG